MGVASKEYKDFIQYKLNEIGDNITTEAIDLFLGNAAFCLEEFGDMEYSLELTGIAKKMCAKLILDRDEYDVSEMMRFHDFCAMKKINVEEMSHYWKILLWEAPYVFESYLLYLEKNRERSERFYEPKMKQLNKHGLIQAMQDLEDDKLDRLTISMPPGTQKTTLEKFFASWITGKHPKDYSLFFSHSGDITRKFYDGILDILTTDEYTWGEIFPDCEITSTNAKLEEININKYKPYSNIQCSSVGAKNSGKVRTNRYLYCDDLIGGIEEALNPLQLDKVWRIYGVDLKQRKLNEQVKEIIIMTRWSTRDPIGRIKDIYGDDERNRFIAIPDIDPITGESNFDYEFNGMSVAFFNDQAMTMDDISYRCLYKNDPIEREGLLYKDDKIRRYASLPTQEPDAVLAICDTKTTGIDYMFLPVFAQYGNDYYMIDCICDDSTDFDVQIARITDILMRNKVQKCEFESNAGGSRLAYDVENNLKEKGYTFCNITTKATESNKETRIIVNAEWIIRQCLFKFKEDYDAKSDYGKAMNFMLTYSVAGKNKFDDVVDGLANFRLFVESMTVVTGVAKAAFNPFRSYRGW